MIPPPTHTHARHPYVVHTQMNRALQEMLLQSGEDGLNATIVLLPAWPCTWDVQFKL